MTGPQTAGMHPKNQGRLQVLSEIAFFVGFAFLSKYLLSLLFWRFAGPVSLLLTLAVLTAWMRSQGTGWSAYGLRQLPDLRSKLMVIPQALLALVAFAVVVAITTIAGPALGLDFLKQTSSGVEDRWGDVAGNWQMFLLWLAIVWTAAAFGEEMFFRGYLISRFQVVFGPEKLAMVAAVVVPALIFGYGHFYYQGLRGLVVTFGIGLVFGTMFLLFKRNLWPLILLHGVIDTLTFTSIFMEWE